ncbi:MAG TPA: 16S rRNA (uracil(1498)-N(3))-methyltransferase [Syntrophales bacterium]|jgi:16S rRNA (uracil1498-N3)-methyltransferase|nr:16S rRNA (uracil(1498)-N(3))-methyltransferase [Syntrophales bacterium]HRT60987.1 16S rRNA (uracil(1498)-N(3))-methyltransferase [Syntrophales bacterium]
MIPRVYFPRTLEPGENLELPADQSRYLRNVLRLRAGDAVTLFDGRGFEYSAVLTEPGGRRAQLRVSAKKRIIEEAVPRITLAQALPKGAKFDWIVQKATELGVARILPFTSARSIPKIPENRGEQKLGRWRKIAAEAAEQCGRSDVPDVPGILSFEAVMGQALPGRLNIIFWEAESERSLREILGGNSIGIEDVFAVVGPEGGFTPQEIDRARAAGFVTASLGSRVLRVETAALAVLAILQFALGGSYQLNGTKSKG